MPLEERSGDFLYGAAASAPMTAAIEDDRVRIVTTDWCAANQGEYFGTTGLQFSEVADRKVKAVSIAALLDA